MMQNPSDATLAPLRNLKYPKWLPKLFSRTKRGFSGSKGPLVTFLQSFPMTAYSNGDQCHCLEKRYFQIMTNLKLKSHKWTL